jgi:hypothetical protein
LASDDEQAILDAVRTVLGEDGLTRAGTGIFLRNGALEASLDHTLVPEHTVDVSIKRATIRRVEADTATVDLDATIATTTKRRDFESRSTARAQGPVSLVREDGAWKVADLVVDGVSLQACFFEGGPTGSSGGVTLRILGGRVFSERVWAYLELVNDLDRSVAVTSVTLAQHRSLLPGWRWARGRIPIDSLRPGRTRVDVVAALKDPHAAARNRVLVQTDAGLVDARPESVWPARRFVPVAVRYPWTSWSAVGGAIVVAAGVLFDWWVASIVLVQVAGVTLLSFEGHLRRGMNRRTIAQLAWVVTCLGAGVALFFANGGLARFRGRSERSRVTAYVRDVTAAKVTLAERVWEERRGPCDYEVWEVRTSRSRWWVVSTKGDRALLPVALYEHDRFPSAPAVVVHQVAARKREAADLRKVLGKRADGLVPTC